MISQVKSGDFASRSIFRQQLTSTSKINSVRVILPFGEISILNINQIYFNKQEKLWSG